MVFSELVSCIKNTIKESGYNTEDVSFNDIMSFLSKSNKLFEYIDSLYDDGFMITRDNLNSVSDPFIGAILDEYISSRNIRFKEDEYIECDDSHGIINSTNQINKIISNSKLLTPEEERDLFLSIRPITARIYELENTIEKNVSRVRNDYNKCSEKTYYLEDELENQIHYLRVLSPEGLEIKKLREQIKPVSDILYRSNIKWVKTIASRFVGKSYLYEDILQVGSIGLLKAIERFEVEKGFKFSTYSHYWIRQSICRELGNNDRLIRLPIHYGEKIRGIKRLRDAYLKNGITISDEELAKQLGITVKDVQDFDKYMMEPTSINVQIGEDEDTTVGDMIPDQNTSIEGDYEKQVLNDVVKKILDSKLKGRERDIIELRFGFRDGKRYTLEEVGSIYNVSRERIRQIEGKCLRKLRTPSCKRELEEFL